MIEPSSPETERKRASLEATAEVTEIQWPCVRRVGRDRKIPNDIFPCAQGHPASVEQRSTLIITTRTEQHTEAFPDGFKTELCHTEPHFWHTVPHPRSVPCRPRPQIRFHLSQVLVGRAGPPNTRPWVVCKIFSLEDESPSRRSNAFLLSLFCPRHYYHTIRVCRDRVLLGRTPRGTQVARPAPLS